MEFSDYMRFVIALAFVLALIALLNWAVRRYGIGGRMTATRGKSRRLQILEVAAIDARHRVVLLRRDETEHLVLLGSASDLVIESNIENQIGRQDGRMAESQDDIDANIKEPT